MWNYGEAHRYRMPVRAKSPGAQSAYDVLMGMRGLAVNFMFLNLAEPDTPVCEIAGFLEAVDGGSVAVGLAAPMPRVLEGTRFGVEVQTGQGIVRFHTEATQLPPPGGQQVSLKLPRQVESVQRRKFSRATVNAPIVFARSTLHPSSAPAVSGSGHTLDISAGGLRFVTTTPMIHNQYIFVTFNTPDGVAYRGLEGRIVRVISGDGRHTIALQFTHLAHETESDLVQTVFRLQLDPARR